MATIHAEAPGLRTSVAIVADQRERLRLVEAWEEMPDFATANQAKWGSSSCTAFYPRRRRT